MLIGFVSDERYLAVHDVSLDFLKDGMSVLSTRSSPRGAVYGELAPGMYTVELARDGFGSKSVDIDLPSASPIQFRLLSDALYGFMKPRWVRGGSESEYCVHAPEECGVSLWRYGLEKKFVSQVNWLGEHGPRASVQITPDGDYTQTGTNWNVVGYDQTHHSLRIRAPQRSGLYYVHLDAKSGDFFGFPWVVAPEEPRADVAVLAATNNWNAYNNFGGRSNYIHPTTLPPRPTMNARAELDRYRPGYEGYAPTNDAYRPLSFHRPEVFNHIPRETRCTDPIRGRQECHTAPAEWRLLAWLEREGYEYDLWSEAQLHFGELDLDAYKVLIMGGHPEYWSTDMYRQVKSWVFDRGGRLMYLGGNGICGAVEFDDESSLRYLNHGEGSDQPMLSAVRFSQHAESPARLLGVEFDERGIMTAAPYRVLDEDHWAFSGTGLKNGDLFGQASLHERVPGGASGHETDKLSPQDSPATIEHLAKGANPDDGGADLVMHATTSNGRVFSAGSITYVASLLVDEPLSRVTSTVLRRFLE